MTAVVFTPRCIDHDEADEPRRAQWGETSERGDVFRFRVTATDKLARRAGLAGHPVSAETGTRSGSADYDSLHQ